MIWKVGDSSEKRRIITVISDGKDCADDTRNAESTENTLKSRGIPVYTMAVENNEGDTEANLQLWPEIPEVCHGPSQMAEQLWMASIQYGMR